MEDNESKTTNTVITYVVVGAVLMMLTVSIVLGCVGIFYQWTAQRMMMTIVASYSPTQELETMLQKYFISRDVAEKEAKKRREE